jgi:hypothetical protein
MDSLGVGLILTAVVAVVFVIALSESSFTIGPRVRKIPLAEFFNRFWGWGDYAPKDWSNAPYKRGFGLDHGL